MLAGIHDLDDDGEVFGKAQQVGRVKDAARAEAGHTLKDGRAREALPAQALDQGVRQRLMPPLVGFPDEDARQNLLAVEHPHGSSPSSFGYLATAQRAAASPPNPAARQSRTVAAMLSIPCIQALSRRYAIVS